MALFILLATFFGFLTPRKIFQPIKDGLAVHGETLAKSHSDGLTTLAKSHSYGLMYVGLGIVVGGISLTIALGLIAFAVHHHSR